MIFSYTDYKKFTSELIASKRMTLRGVCQQTDIQPPYLTKVLKHGAHLTSEQLYRLSRLFNLTEEEEDYYFLLLNYSKAETKEYRARLKEKIFSVREKKLHLFSHERNAAVPQSNSHSMKLIEFYLSPNQQIIYKALRISKYCSNPYLLCNKIGILEAELDDTLVRLERLGLLKRRNFGYEVVDPEPTLAGDHALLPHHHRNWRIEAMKRHFPANGDNLKLTVTICSDTNAQKVLRGKIMKLVAEFEKESSKKTPMEIFQLNVDLFSVC